MSKLNDDSSLAFDPKFVADVNDSSMQKYKIIAEKSKSDLKIANYSAKEQAIQKQIQRIRFEQIMLNKILSNKVKPEELEKMRFELATKADSTSEMVYATPYFR